MSGQQELDRNEDATGFKLEKAHRRGSIAKSAEVGFAFVLVAATACLYGLGESTLRELATLLPRAFMHASQEQLSAAGALRLVSALGSFALQAVAAILFVVWLTALVLGAAQARGVFTAEPLKPQFERINPAANFKRLFSVKTVYETARTSLKLAFMAAVVGAWGWAKVDEFLGLLALPSGGLLRQSIALLGEMLALVAVLFAMFAYVDWLFTRWEFLRQMRMSKREVKEEHKEREGDPRIKQRLRELRAEWAKRARSVKKVGEADVLLTNPTHYAVAVEYRHGEMPAPRVTAKGAGELALRMRREASRRGVPIVQNAPLARALFADVEQDRYVPEQHFGQLARILRWVYAARPASRPQGA
ncbi:EscU/YscU/HrcU family type III secretion system export apparatus switch protein [Aquabacterium sp. A7-Y]|uniref:EscU/YscU/HrcU family type III secretion system export apparatus switch protein n=1 Tax=Aquabacterium sp. A7-Y TaxID=1349605 RepID=UPI00223E65A9|nr:EscU/YscU/HrcU family type III secretion system export apparatus switch protein [Aquabacterium sp. A7-Y]MCW7540885.1 EscU/YscU/HrcU family type III secretion system export apparatus switch protein [Aquabacterium sp. A7-Y]